MNSANLPSQSFPERVLQQFANNVSINNQYDFDKMIMQVPVGISVFYGPAFIVEIANDNYLTLVDRSKENFIGKPLLEAIPELKGQEAEKLLNDVLYTGQSSYGCEFKISLVRNGKREDAYFDFVYQPLKDNEENVTGVIAVAYEVTASVKAQHTLSESEKQFRKMVMQSPVAMAIFRGDEWVIDIANDALLKKIWQKELHEVQGKKLSEVFLESENQSFTRLLKQVRDTGTSYRENEVLSNINADKGEARKCYLDFEYAPLFELDGETVSGVIVTALDVTAQVIARKKTEENEIYLQRMADNMPSMLFMSGNDGYFTFHNSQWYDYTGMTKEESNGFGWLAAVHDDQRSDAEKIIKNAIAAGREYDIEFKLRKKDGSYRWFVKSGKPGLDINGNAEGYLGALIDIHERKLAEEILKESRQSLKLAIESAELGTWDYDPATNTLQWDTRTKKLFGLPPGEPVTYDLFLKVVHEDDKAIVNEAVQNATSDNSDGDYAIEYRIFRLTDNVMRWIRAKGKAFFSEKNMLERFLGTVYDITEQKESIQKMEDAEARLRLATEGAGIATWDLDLKNYSIIYSPRLAEIFGKPGVQSITHPEMRLQIHPDDLHAIVEKAFNKAIETGLYFYEARVVWPDKTIHWVRTRGRVLFNEKNEPQRMLGTMQDITAEKQASIALQQSEIRYRHLIYGLPVAFYTCDVEGRIGIYNEAALELWGRTPAADDRWCGSFKIFQTDGKPLPTNECPMAITLTTGKVVRGVEIIVERPDGTRVNVLPHPQPVFDEKGDIVGGLNMLVDITDRKIAEKNTARLAAIVQSSDDAIISKTLEGIITSWNPAAEKLFGYTAEQMIGESINKLIPKDRLEEEPAIISRIKRGEPVEHFETMRMRSDGKLINISLSISPLKDSNGNLIGASKIARDITVQKNLNDALQESELLFKTIANVAPVGLWMTDKEASNNFVNDTWVEWTGMSLEEHYNGGWMSRVVPEDAARVRGNFLKSLAKTESFSDEFRLRRKDGEIRWCLTEGFPYYNNDGGLEGYAGSVTDITDRKMIEEELEKKVSERTQELNLSNTALEKSNEELEQFAYVASHDLQEPLRKIKTFVGRMQEVTFENNNEGPGKAYMEKILSATNRMSDLIRDLLEYSRTARISEKRSLVDLNVVLETVKNDFELFITQEKATIQSEKLPELNAVPHQMNQLFTNLVSNSLKFAQEDRPLLLNITCCDLTAEQSLMHSLDPQKSYVEIIFSDNGIGFSNEYSEKVFEIFQRLNPRSAYIGSGIGLSICRKIAINHNGLIFADSTEGKGTTFHVILPIEK